MNLLDTLNKLERRRQLAICHRQIAEAHTAMAQLLEGIELPIAQPAETSKYKASNGSYISCQEWRYILLQNEAILQRTVGTTDTFSAKRLRDLIHNYVDLSPGDMHLVNSGGSPKPRWWALLTSAINVMPQVWPGGRAVVVRAQLRGTYRLVRASQ